MNFRKGFNAITWTITCRNYNYKLILKLPYYLYPDYEYGRAASTIQTNSSQMTFSKQYLIRNVNSERESNQSFVTLTGQTSILFQCPAELMCPANFVFVEPVIYYIVKCLEWYLRCWRCSKFRLLFRLNSVINRRSEGNRRDSKFYE